MCHPTTKWSLTIGTGVMCIRIVPTIDRAHASGDDAALDQAFSVLAMNPSGQASAPVAGGIHRNVTTISPCANLHFTLKS
jgi:hypothetical protein